MIVTAKGIVTSVLKTNGNEDRVMVIADTGERPIGLFLDPKQARQLWESIGTHLQALEVKA